MTDIDTAKTGLVVGAAVLASLALFGRGRLAMIMLAAALFSVLALLALEINAAWMSSLDARVWNWFYRHRFHRAFSPTSVSRFPSRWPAWRHGAGWGHRGRRRRRPAPAQIASGASRVGDR